MTVYGNKQNIQTGYMSQVFFYYFVKIRNKYYFSYLV